MWWAFWRRRREANGRPSAEPGAQPAPERAPAPPPPRHDPDDGDAAAPAFSGASPSPGQVEDLQEVALDLTRLRDAPAAVRAVVARDLPTLVHAALERDAARAQATQHALAEQEALEAAVVAAVAVLRERFALLADSDELDAVLAQGQLVADRAVAPLRVLAPDSPRSTLRRVVDLACGVRHPGDEASAPAGDLLLVAAALLAQTVDDGAGDVGALARELAALEPGPA